MTRIKISLLVLGVAALLGAPSAADAQAPGQVSVCATDARSGSGSMWSRRIDDLAHERRLMRSWSAADRERHFGVPCAAPVREVTRMAPMRLVGDAARARREARMAERATAR